MSRARIDRLLICAALVATWALVCPSSAFAACGDYLADSHVAAKQPGKAPKPCHGPLCSQAPASKPMGTTAAATVTIQQDTALPASSVWTLGDGDAVLPDEPCSPFPDQVLLLPFRPPRS